jgi:hypothetical protein
MFHELRYIGNIGVYSYSDFLTEERKLDITACARGDGLKSAPESGKTQHTRLRALITLSLEQSLCHLKHLPGRHFPSMARRWSAADNTKRLQLFDKGY